MADYVNFTIGLRRQQGDVYSVEMSLRLPGSDLTTQLGPGTAHFDQEVLRLSGPDSDSYGRILSGQLFGHESTRVALAQARSFADSQGLQLRLRLWIADEARELHSLRWETLQDLTDGSSLLVNERVLFSRYLASRDWRIMEHRARAELRALVAIANPDDMALYRDPAGDQPLPPVDVDGETKRAQNSLAPIETILLASGGTATFDRILARLREGFDILYLVCHGIRSHDESWLWLEDEAGTAARVPGGEFVRQITRLAAPPRLVVLAACQTAGDLDDRRSRDNGALAGLGAQLTEEGIPAVVAMQANVTMRTIEQFMPAFFTEIQRSGQVDLAMTRARTAVRARHDYWVPTLFMRLESGRIWWYDPGFTGGDETFRRWPDILDSIRNGECTPILGPGLHEFLLGSTREIAQHWATAENFPLSAYAREDLPRVAQFIATMHSPKYWSNQLESYLREKLLERYRADLPVELHDAPLDDLITAVGARRRAESSIELHSVLARFPLPLYLTANSENLMADALHEQPAPRLESKKNPQVVLCPWNRSISRARCRLLEDPPTVARPLVYHLFGRLGESDSLVLTEDDYFNYLIGVAENKNRIPEVVRRALVDTSLLFLGFQLDDWNFRVLFRSIMHAEGGDRRSKYAHVAVQVSPDQVRFTNPKSVQDFLERDLGLAQVSIFWGGVDDFAKELQRRWTAGSDLGRVR
jgi:CHAT domain-containing protein